MQHTIEDNILNLILKKLDFGKTESIIASDLKPNFDINTIKLDCILKIAESENLIIRKSNTYVELTKRGFDIKKEGGWIKHLESIEFEKQKLLKNDKLDREIKILQKDNFEYQQVIREQKNRIRDLDEQIKFISLIKLYWWIIPICITIGIFLAKALDLLMLQM